MMLIIPPNPVLQKSQPLLLLVISFLVCLCTRKLHRLVLTECRLQTSTRQVSNLITTARLSAVYYPGQPSEPVPEKRSLTHALYLCILSNIFNEFPKCISSLQHPLCLVVKPQLHTTQPFYGHYTRQPVLSGTPS